FGSLQGTPSIGRYEQVYNAALFPGPLTVNAIGFFRTQFLLTGSFTGQTYTFRLTTSSKPVNGLDLDNGNANVGLDEKLFAQMTLSGAAPNGELLITGTPFFYQPALGNLLLDITITGTGNYFRDDLYFDSRNTTSGGQFS